MPVFLSCTDFPLLRASKCRNHHRAATLNLLQRAAFKGFLFLSKDERQEDEKEADCFLQHLSSRESFSPRIFLPENYSSWESFSLRILNKDWESSILVSHLLQMNTCRWFAWNTVVFPVHYIWRTENSKFWFLTFHHFSCSISEYDDDDTVIQWIKTPKMFLLS